MEAGDLIAGIKGLGSAENLTEGELEGAGEVGPYEISEISVARGLDTRMSAPY